MGAEIERKFLIQNNAWREHVYRSKRLCQGYLISDEASSVRVRISDDEAHLNIKSGALAVHRREYEYIIPLADAHEILDSLCAKPLLEKTRHWVRHGDHVWEIDVFHGDNAGLVLAEVELSDVAEPVELPSWIGAEVSHDIRYYNPYLVQCPYKGW